MLGDFINFTKGFAFKSSSFISKGIKIVKVGNLNSNMSESSDWYFIDESEFEIYQKYQIKDDDVIVSTVGSWENNPNSKVGNVCIFFDVKEKLLLNQNAVIIRTNDNEILRQKYLKYLIYNKSFSDYIIGCAQGSANQASITLNDIRNYKVKIPDIKIQDKIVSILDSIILKINLNNGINNNLQDLVRSIYYEKFNNKSNNGKLKDILELHRNGLKNKDESLKYFPVDVLPMKYLITKDGKPNEEAQSSLVEFKKYDILIGAMRVYFHRVCLAAEDGITRTTTFVLRPKDYNYLYYSLITLDKDDFIKYANDGSKGSTMPYAVWDNNCSEYEIYLPTLDEAKEFNDLVKPLFEIQIINEKNRKDLEELRDTLLPMLMNGGIDLDNIEI